MRASLFAACVLGLATVGLAGCSGSEEPVAEAPEGVPGLTISNARLVLGPNKTGSIYFDLAYDNERGLSLSRASVSDAQEATMMEFGEYDFKIQAMDMLPVPMTKGTKVSFAPGGKHIAVIGLKDGIKPGDTTELTLIVSGGDKSSFDVPVKAAGDDS